MSAKPRDAWLTWLLAVLAASLALALLLARGWWLPVRAPLDVNEGWNAIQAMRAWAWGGLYPDPDALTGNNYPPLSFYLVGGLGRIVGDDVIAGRIVALLAEVTTGAAVYAIVARLTRSRQWAWVGLLLFVGLAATILRRYTLMNDPQWLALAATSQALSLIVRPSARRIPIVAVAWAAALTVAGMFIKHNVVAIPIAITGWLWFRDRRALAVWCGIGAGLTGIALAAIYARWGTAPFIGTFGESRQYSLHRMVAKGGADLLALLPVLIAAAPRRPLAAPNAILPALLVVIAVTIGLIERSGDGVDINAWFDAVVALAIAVPVASAADPALARIRLALSLLPILCLAPFAMRDDVTEIVTRNAEAHRWASLIAGVAGARGPVACGDQAICYWAGREAGLDFFMANQRLLARRGQTVRIAIERRQFALIEMRSDGTGGPSDLLRPLIWVHYRPQFTSGDRELLVPANLGSRAR